MQNQHQHSLSEFLSLSEKDICKEYENLHQEFNESDKYSKELYKCSKEEEECNRYSDIVPYKHNMVSHGNQYFNASSVELLSGNRIISTQAPVPPFENFWRIVVNENVGLIVMLCALSDPKRNIKQAEVYWPEKGTRQAGGVEIQLVQDVKKLGDLFDQRKLVAKTAEKQKALTHLHWYGWQDFGVPSKESANIVQKIVERIFETFKKGQNVVMHCSAGVGRTGTLIAAVDGVGLLDRGDQNVSVSSIAANIRKQRFGSIQTLPQYQFVYEFMRRHLAKKQ